MARWLSTILSVGAGYGYVKAVTSSGKRCIYPAVTAPYARRLGLGHIMGSAKLGHSVALKAKDAAVERYLVGDAALVARGAVRSWDVDQAKRDNIGVLVATAAGLMQVNGKVGLAVGVPLGLYGEQAEALAERLRYFRGEVSVDDGSAVPVEWEEVFVFPQGGGAYYHAVCDIDGSLRDVTLTKGAVGVIETGYRTTEFLVMERRGKMLVVREELSGTIDLGLVWAYQRAQASLEARIGRSVDLLRVERVIDEGGDPDEGGVIVYEGEPIDLMPDYEEAKDGLADAFTGRIQQAWGEDLSFLLAVVVAGGGGQALYTRLKSIHRNTQLVSDPVFANALGAMAAWSALSEER